MWQGIWKPGPQETKAITNSAGKIAGESENVHLIAGIAATVIENGIRWTLGT
jgi:hypothetical protein